MAVAGVGAASIPTLLSARAVSGATSPSPQAVSGEALEFGAWEFQPDTVRAFLAEWTAKTGVPVNLTIAPYAGYPAAIQTRLLGGGRLDVYYNRTVNQQKFFKQNWAADVSRFPDAQKVIDDMFPPARARHVTPEGQILSVPYYSTTYSLHYNKKHLEDAGIEAPPESLTDVHDQCTKLRDSGIAAYPYSAQWQKDFMEEYFCTYLLAEGITPFDEQGNPVFADNPKSVDVMGWWQSLYADKLTSPTILTDDFNASFVNVAQGTATFHTMHHYLLRLIREAAGAGSPNMFIHYRMPGAAGTTLQAGEVIQMGTQLEGTQADYAWDLMKFYGWKDETGEYATFKAWAKAAALAAPYPAFFEDPEVKADYGDYYDLAELARVFESASEVVPARTFDWYSAFQVEAGDRLQSMVAGSTTPAQAVADLADAAHRLAGGGI
jgi:multiple sugar transport system substrate-binding protein